MNLDFDLHPGFTSYCLLLMLSGAFMVLLSTVRGPSMGTRFFNAAFGAGFLGYGFYLAFLFTGGHYLIFFKAFFLPVVMLVRTLKGRPLVGGSRTGWHHPSPPPAWAPPATTTMTSTGSMTSSGAMSSQPQQVMPAHWPAPTVRSTDE